MVERVEHGGGWRGSPWRVIGWGTAGLLLLLPWVTNAPWTAADFVVAAMLLGGVVLAFEAIFRKSGRLGYRCGAGLAIVAAFATIWVNGAVGMIGSEANPYNLLFGGVLLLALTGAILARFEAAGMARAMVATAIAQAAVGAFGHSTDPRGGMLSVVFAGLWLVAGALFQTATRDRL